MRFTHKVIGAAVVASMTVLVAVSPWLIEAAERAVPSPVFVPTSAVGAEQVTRSQAIGIPADLQVQLDTHGYKQIAETYVRSQNGDLLRIDTIWEAPELSMLLIELHSDHYRIDRAGFYADGKWHRWCNVPNGLDVPPLYQVQVAVNAGSRVMSPLAADMPEGCFQLQV